MDECAEALAGGGIPDASVIVLAVRLGKTHMKNVMLGFRLTSTHPWSNSPPACHPDRSQCRSLGHCVQAGSS